MSSRKNSSVLGLLTLGLLAALLCACVANAAPSFQGKFTLPNEVRWGKAMLPAGDYLLRVDHVNAATLVTIQEAKSRNTVAIVLSTISDGNKNIEEGSALLIGTRGGQSVVHSLRLAELGMVLVYDPSLARARKEIEEAHNNQAVPVTAAMK